MDGEAIRQAILDYLYEIRGSQKELSGVEQDVKSVLATDKRIKELKAATIRHHGDIAEIDIWDVDTRTGLINIILESRDKTSHYSFTGCAKVSFSGVQVTIDESAHGISKRGYSSGAER
jgi:hypothetical protein